MRALTLFAHYVDFNVLPKCAARAQQDLAHFWSFEVAHEESTFAHFYSEPLRNTSGFEIAPSVDDHHLALHFAHGNQYGFHVTESRHGSRTIGIEELGPGWRHCRYLWLIACNLMAHGARPHQPFLPCSHGICNVFRRWGQSRSADGESWSPLAEGVRMICGGSTKIYAGHQEILSPVFRLIHGGHALADAFILGLAGVTSTGKYQTPLCATQANAIDDNPLFDRSWNLDRNPGGDHLFIQYPIQAQEPDGLAYQLELSLDSPETGPPPALEGPNTLPILSIRFDEERQESFARLVDEIGEGGPIRAEHQRETGTLHVELDSFEGIAEPGLAALLGIIQEGLTDTPRSDHPELSLFTTHNQILRQQIDGFPIAQIPSNPYVEFPFEELFSQEKCRYLLPKYSLGRHGPEYEILDPDLGVLLMYQETLLQDLESGDPSPLKLQVHGWRIGSSSDRSAELIDPETAEQRAWQAIQRYDDGEAERVDRQRIDFRIGYRLYASGPYTSPESLGSLVPHYLVRYLAENPEEDPMLTVEVSGIED